MHLTAMNAPIRTAVLGSRFSGCWTASISSGSTTTTTGPSSSPVPAARQPWMQTKCNYRYNSQRQRRTVSTCTKPSFTQSLLRQTTTTTTTTTTCRRPAAAPAAPAAVPTLLSIIRHSSSSSSPSPSSDAAKQSSSSTEPVRLDWNTFFTLRTSRRRYTLVSSILSSIATTSAGITVLATQNLETIGAQLMGLDPIAVMVLLTASAGAVGWLMGPFLGGAVWRAIHRKYTGAVAIKEKEFYNRIKRFRVDPSAQSFSNPVPDYYGEKIGSVAGYRRWLKDQRAYNRKKQKFL